MVTHILPGGLRYLSRSQPVGEVQLGVDRHVGHGSADALFSLTAEQYEAALIGDGSLYDFRLECWKGAREDRLMFEPAGGAWMPEQWTPARARMLPQKFVGEIWHHVDALDAEEGSEQRKTSAALANGTASVATGEDGVRRMSFRLTGKGAYPRPGSVIAGLRAGSTREDVRRVLGEPTRGIDTYPIEGDLLELGYDGEGLALITILHPAPRPLPDGAIRTLLSAVGEPEEGRAFREVLRRAAAENRRRWIASSGRGRRLIELDSGVEIQTEDATVVSVHVALGVNRLTEALFPGIRVPPTRADVESQLGPASDATAGTELRTYGDRELVISYDGAHDVASDLTAVARGTAANQGMHRWRSGEFTQFLDVLGLADSHPLVAAVRELDGVRIDTRRGRVTAVTIGRNGHQAERFAAFVDGGSAEPTLADHPFGGPRYQNVSDPVTDFEGAYVQLHATGGSRISWITVRQDTSA